MTEWQNGEIQAHTATNSLQTPFLRANAAKKIFPTNGPANHPIPAKLSVPIARTMNGSRPVAAEAAASRSFAVATDRPVAVDASTVAIEKTRPVTLRRRRRSKNSFQFSVGCFKVFASDLVGSTRVFAVVAGDADADADADADLVAFLAPRTMEEGFILCNVNLSAVICEKCRLCCLLP